MSATSGRSILRDVRLIDGIAATAREHVDLVIDAGRVAALDDHRPDRVIEPPTSSGTGPAPRCSRDSSTATRITRSMRVWRSPDGITDAYRADPATAAFIGARNAAMALRSGVTTARSGGAAHSRDLGLRDAIAAGHVPGPRLLAAGGAITITGGHGWQFGHEADGVDELVKLTRSLARDGVDHFKIVASEAAQITTAVAGVEELTLEEVTAIVAEARRLRRRVMSHAQSSGAVITSARGGVDSVEHAFLADRAALETLAECGTTLVPTLTVTDVYRDIPGVSEAVQARQRELTVQHRTSCETAIGLGIPMATGTDCGVRGVMPDMLWREIYNLYDHGLSPMDAIKAGTSGAARLLGLEAEAGTVAVGRAADLVVVAGDPLADLRRLATPSLVLKGGRPGPRGRPELRPDRESRRPSARHRPSGRGRDFQRPTKGEVHAEPRPTGTEQQHAQECRLGQPLSRVGPQEAAEEQVGKQAPRADPDERTRPARPPAAVEPGHPEQHGTDVEQQQPRSERREGTDGHDQDEDAGTCRDRQVADEVDQAQVAGGTSLERDDADREQQTGDRQREDETGCGASDPGPAGETGGCQRAEAEQPCHRPEHEADPRQAPGERDRRGGEPFAGVHGVSSSPRPRRRSRPGRAAEPSGSHMGSDRGPRRRRRSAPWPRCARLRRAVRSCAGPRAA